MKKIRMIVSAVAVFAIVGGGLAFKNPGLNAFDCASNVCRLRYQSVDPNGVDFHYSHGAVTNINIAGLPCLNRCDQPVDYSLE